MRAGGVFLVAAAVVVMPVRGVLVCGGEVGVGGAAVGVLGQLEIGLGGIIGTAVFVAVAGGWARG